jgi:hypothetical protein
MVVFLMFALGALVTTQHSAKAMFYDPADSVATGAAVKTSAQSTPDPRPIIYARPLPPLGHVGIHYWFEDDGGNVLSESRAAHVAGSLTLHIRNNVGGGFLTVWSIDGNGDGAELTPRLNDRFDGHQMTAEPFVSARLVRFEVGERAPRLIVVFGRSQTEMASSANHARQRLTDLSSRMGRDRLPQIIRESDDTTAGEVGTYVVNREGMPVATEIALRRR